MSKALKRTICVALVGILALALVACGAASDELTGTSWKLTGGEAMGMQMGEEDVASFVGSMSLEFLTGGKVEFDLNGEKGRSNYTLSGNTVTLKDSAGSMSASINGDEMRMEQTQDGIVVTLIFTKQ